MLRQLRRTHQRRRIRLNKPTPRQPLEPAPHRRQRPRRTRLGQPTIEKHPKIRPNMRVLRLANISTLAQLSPDTPQTHAPPAHTPAAYGHSPPAPRAASQETFRQLDDQSLFCSTRTPRGYASKTARCRKRNSYIAESRLHVIRCNALAKAAEGATTRSRKGERRKIAAINLSHAPHSGCK